MCGIAGFVDLWAASEIRVRDERAQTLDNMCRFICHRCPDDQGCIVMDVVALGMRRLSIIDLSGGRQPISNEDRTVTIVFNGEIYNYRDLQAELQIRGHRLETNSDTETIVHSYEEYGSGCVESLRGMFSFALWDDRPKTLLV